MIYPENPIITCVERTGYPPGMKTVMDDTNEARREYIDDEPADFVKMILRRYPELADEYTKIRWSDYNRWRGGAAG